VGILSRRIPTFRPYGTLGNGGVAFVFYPHFVPTGPRETPVPVFSTYIASLRVYPHSVPTGLPTFRPYGTTGNTGAGVFYPYSVPTGLPTSRPYGTTGNTGVGVSYPYSVPTGLPTLRPYGSTYIASLRDHEKYRGWCFLLRKIMTAHFFLLGLPPQQKKENSKN